MAARILRAIGVGLEYAVLLTGDGAWGTGIEALILAQPAPERIGAERGVNHAVSSAEASTGARRRGGAPEGA